MSTFTDDAALLSGSPPELRNQQAIKLMANTERSAVATTGTTTPAIRLFVKYIDVVRKVAWTGGDMKTLEEICARAFADKFTEPGDLHGINFLTTEKVLGIQYQLQDTADLVDGSELELRAAALARRPFIGYGGRERVVFAMVGLPARGKSYIARKVVRYLNWIGVEAKVFNVGNYRREYVGPHQGHEFFRKDNVAAQRQRLQCAVAALDDMIRWVHQSGYRSAVYDATNTTAARRDLIVARCQQDDVRVVFIESICEDPVVVENNIRDTKLQSPDYVGVDAEDAVEDFLQRIDHYNEVYETVRDEETQYIKLFDVGRKVVINNLQGYLSSRVVFLLMNLHLTRRPIWLTRHGQSEYNLTERIGGDSALTQLGQEYAHTLSEWVMDRMSEDYSGSKLTVWTSTLKRTIRTAQFIPATKLELKSLDEIDAGTCDGMTYEEIAEKMPQEFKARAANKFSYRYPRGESYEDVMLRIEPTLIELERQRSPILVVAHQAVIRCIYAYLMDLDPTRAPVLPIPLHTVIEITPQAYGMKEKQFKLL